MTQHLVPMVLMDYGEKWNRRSAIEMGDCDPFPGALLVDI